MVGVCGFAGEGPGGSVLAGAGWLIDEWDESFLLLRSVFGWLCLSRSIQ